MSDVDPGWYLDPINPARIRFHDGARWTEQVQPNVSDLNPPTAPGWYPDPLDSMRSRYFDDGRWTDQTRPHAVSLASASPGQHPDVPFSAPAKHSTNLNASSGRREPLSPRVPVLTTLLVVAVSVLGGLLLALLLANRDGGATAGEDATAQPGAQACMPSAILNRYKAELDLTEGGPAGFENKAQVSLWLSESTQGINPAISAAAAEHAEALVSASREWETEADGNLSDWISAVSRAQGRLEEAISDAAICP